MDVSRTPFCLDMWWDKDTSKGYGKPFGENISMEPAIKVLLNVGMGQELLFTSLNIAGGNSVIKFSGV